MHECRAACLPRRVNHRKALVKTSKQIHFGGVKDIDHGVLEVAWVRWPDAGRHYEHVRHAVGEEEGAVVRSADGTR